MFSGGNNPSSGSSGMPAGTLGGAFDAAAPDAGEASF